MIKLVKFYTKTCAPCKDQDAVLSGIKLQYPEVEFVNIDIEEGDKLVAECCVRSVPTLAFIMDGKIEKTLVGLQFASTIRNELDKLT